MSINYLLIKGRILKKIKRLDFHDYRVIVVMILLCLLIGWGIYVAAKKIIDYYATTIYEAAIIVRDQYNSDPIEDARSSLKIGDVLALKPEGHSWSEIEKVSYLIIKMELNKSQAVKIMQSKYQKAKYNDMASQARMDLNERIKKDGLKEVPQEVVSARQYRVDMEKYFKDFEPFILLHKQPYQYQTYDWKIVEKK